MFLLKTLILCTAYLAVFCQHQGPTTTPVPILKQINRQNDDGSYSYGYEAADGSFKIETKYPNGDVAGKYGYVDENGKSREISYGASSQRGFEPEGPGIQVPPPTLHNPQSSNALTDGQEDDGQYREDPSIYEDPKYNGRAQSRPSPIRQFHQPAQPAPTQAPAPQYQSQPAPSQFRSAPLYSQQTSLFNQGPQQFPSQNQDFRSQNQEFRPQSQEFRPQSQVYHQQPQFSYQAYTPQPYQNFQNQNFQSQSQSFQPQPSFQSSFQQQPAYQPQSQGYQNQNYDQFLGHPAQNFDPNTGSYSINFTG